MAALYAHALYQNNNTLLNDFMFDIMHVSMSSVNKAVFCKPTVAYGKESDPL